MSGDGSRGRSGDRRWTRLRFGLFCSLLLVVGIPLAMRIGDRSSDPTAVVSATVRQLWLSPERYEGKHVATRGFVRVFLLGRSNEHFAVEQAGQHRVGLQGVAREQLLTLVGEEVAVEGVLRIEEGSGIYIHIERLTLVGERTNRGSAMSVDPRSGVRPSSTIRKVMVRRARSGTSN